MSGALILALVTFAPIRVACVGDSITQGRGGQNCYPAQLQQFLGSGYEVRNFGRTSASVLPGKLQYIRLPEYRSTLEFQPDRVLIMLGTNDSAGPNWSNRRDAFRTEFQRLISGFESLPSKPRVTVVVPPPMFFGSDDWRRRNLDGQIKPLLERIAFANGIKTYSAWDLFSGKPDLMPDKLHPSNFGFRILARDVADKVFGVRSKSMKTVDWANDKARQVTVDQEAGQYLGHVSTTLLEDNKTILAVYPKGHGKGPIVCKKSPDGGKTWSERLPMPENWSTSLETPTIHRVGSKRLILWSGLYPARIATSDDEGNTWTPLRPVGDWGGIVVMGFVEPTIDRRLIAMFHDDGRFLTKDGKGKRIFTLYQVESKDLGESWSEPRALFVSNDVHLCEPGQIRSDDGKQIAVLLRENKRVKPSHIFFTNDEGRTWSEPRQMHPALSGDRHTLKRLPDGRIVAVFRDMLDGSPWKGDFVAWVGTYEDLVAGREGQYRIRLLDNVNSWDSSYPGLELLPDGTLVATTYGQWEQGKPQFIKSVRFNYRELP
jgi:lysophospholipase L1-like esterase